MMNKGNVKLNEHISKENYSTPTNTRINNTEDKNKQIQIVIDDLVVYVDDVTKNIVEIAKEVNIGIPAPCFHAKRKGGCCNACVIEVDGEQSFACATKPKNGMNIRVNREDLIALRKERLLAYKEGLKNGTTNKCSCS